MPARAPRPPMGIATETTAQNKQVYLDFLARFSGTNPDSVESAIPSLFHHQAEIHASHPVNVTEGGIGYRDDVLWPIANALQGLRRHDDIVIGGEYLGGEWVTSTGYYSGHFTRPLFGIPPSGKLAFLRIGEFHRMEEGKIVQSHIFLGLAELIIALGLWPLAPSQGYEGVVPGPSTHDGVLNGQSNPARSRASADLVENMLLELTSPEKAWRSYWHDNMVWYGPGSFGSYATLDAFEAFQVPFEQTFEGWGDGQREGITGVGSNCKAGDGDYAFLCGWPQITGIHVKPFLGIEPKGQRVTMRDCDWWRCENGKIIENWCMLDVIDVALQLGRDILGEIQER